MKLGFSLLLLCMWPRVGHAQFLPTLRGRSLDGGAVSLPADLHGKIGVFVVGFSKQSGESGKVWGKAIADAYAHDDRVAYYEVPVLAAVPALLRGVVLRSMRHSISKSDQTHVVPALQDATQWKDAVRFSAADEAYVVVVNRTGVIQLRMHGAMTPASQRALLDAVRALAQPTVVGQGPMASGRSGG